MKNILKISTALLLIAAGTTSCIKETFPQGSTVTDGQVNNSPGTFETFVSACTSTLVGRFTYSGSDFTPYDFGYPTFFIMRDVMGQDFVPSTKSFYSPWYQVSAYIGANYANAQVAWTYYYGWIKTCNKVIGMAGETPAPEHMSGAGIAYAMRAMFYMDLARTYQYTYKGNELAGTVPIVTEKTTTAELSNNPRATNEKMWAFILDDLNKAEQYIADYKRSDIYTPDLSVVYGLKARAYLTMENFSEAERYAKKAQEGYSPLTEEEYLDRLTAFNTPNDAWIFAVTYKPDDPNILENDSDSNWGSQMFLEVKDMLYASNYGDPKRIDAHLFETIPATDLRRKCFIDPALDEIEDEAEFTEALKAYTDYPDRVSYAASASDSPAVGCMSLKFRAGGGVEGRENSYAATCVAVPLMRVEEMMLIEAEAAGMQEEARGKSLLTAFAKLRDPQYVYDDMKSFRDNVWWQRRVELWGEGFAMFDIKRLNKGITRSYAGTNHPQDYRYNTQNPPSWMNWVITNGDVSYNHGITENNPLEIPTGDSPEHVW